MMGKVLAMFGFSETTKEPDRRLVELDVQIQTEKRLARLAKSELIENLFQQASDEVRHARK